MDSLKAAAKALRDSPKVIRKKIGHGDGKHEKLEDDWLHSKDPVESGVHFYVKYLGTMQTEKTHGPGSTDSAVKNIIQHAKNRTGSSSKLQKVQLIISSKSIVIINLADDTKLDEEPLYRVSYCSVDPYYTNVFCYISRNKETKVPECHAYLCTSKSKAEAVTLTVAQAFNIAYEAWQKKKVQAQVSDSDAAKTSTAASKSPEPDIGGLLSMEDPKIPSPPRTTKDDSSVPVIKTTLAETPPVSKVDKDPFSKEFESTLSSDLQVKATITKAKSMDQLQMEDELDTEFAILANARSNPHLLDTGPVSNELNPDVMQFLRGDMTSPSTALGTSANDLLNL